MLRYAHLEPETAAEYIVPYKLMAARLQAKLDRESDPGKREFLEFQITVLLGLIEVMAKVGDIAEQVLDKAAR